MVAVPKAVIGRDLTLADYLALPDDYDYEIVEGVLHVAPRPTPKHQMNAYALARTLTEAGDGTVIPDADLAVDDRDTYVSPDLMFFVGDRFATQDLNQMVRIIPDLVVEVLSPGTSRYDQTTKLRLYERLGVPYYWTVDSDRRAITEYVLQPDGTYNSRTVRAPEVFQPILFPHLELNLADLLA